MLLNSFGYFSNLLLRTWVETLQSLSKQRCKHKASCKKITLYYSALACKRPTCSQGYMYIRCGILISTSRRFLQLSTHFNFKPLVFFYVTVEPLQTARIFRPDLASIHPLLLLKRRPPLYNSQLILPRVVIVERFKVLYFILYLMTSFAWSTIQVKVPIECPLV